MESDDIDRAQRYVLSSVSGLLERLTVDLLAERPEAIVPFMLAWLDSKGEAALQAAREEANPRPVGVERSESESEEEDAEEARALARKLEERRGKARKQRCSVSAEVYGLYNPKGHFQPRVVAKSEATKQRIRALLQKVFMFRNLDEENMEVVLDALEVRDFAPGQAVIRQGDDGHELFVVGEGQLACSKRFPGKTEDTFLKHYGPGELFGELALLYNAPRAASIAAVGRANLFSLDRECFNHIVKDSAIQNREKFEGFLARVELLSSLDAYERSKICDCLIMQTFEAGQRVIYEGEAGDSFYLILEGEARALKTNPQTGREEAVFEYKENMYFGELALLRGEPRAASIEAKVC